ncbi:MAG: CopG family transcriptional regulator [Candidatus Rokuibacteriota bacterium]
MATRVSTNVRLDPAELRQLKRLAAERGVTLSAIFQEMIGDYIGRVGALTGKDWEKDPFFKVGRRPGRSGSSRVAAQHDRYLYRTKR